MVRPGATIMAGRAGGEPVATLILRFDEPMPC